MLEKVTQSASISLEDKVSLRQRSRTKRERPCQQKAGVREKKKDDAHPK